jgi:hypothetical protein
MSAMSATDEKQVDTATASSPPSSLQHGTHEEGTATTIVANNKLQQWANRLDDLAGVEARGIERVPEELRDRKVTTRDYVHMFTIWFSMYLQAKNMAENKCLLNFQC